MKIAIVEDEKEHAELLSSYLGKWGQASGDVPDIRRYESAEFCLTGKKKRISPPFFWTFRWEK